MSRIRWRLKWYLRLLGSYLGIYNPWSDKQGELHVVVFHGICEDHQEYINGRFLRVKDFNRFLKLARQKTTLVSLDQVLKQELDTKRPNLLLTFDDGYENNLKLALPVLKEHQAPALVFVTGQEEYLWMDLLDAIMAFEPEEFQSWIHTKKRYPHDNNALKQLLMRQSPETIGALTEELMKRIESCDFSEKQRVFLNLLSDKQLQVLSEESLISLANHGKDHLLSDTLSVDEVLAQFKSVEQRLELPGNTFPKVIAFPFGQINENMSGKLAEAGFQVQFGMDSHPGNDNVIERVTYNPFVSPKLNMLILGNKGYK